MEHKGASRWPIVLTFLWSAALPPAEVDMKTFTMLVSVRLATRLSPFFVERHAQAWHRHTCIIAHSGSKLSRCHKTRSFPQRWDASRLQNGSTRISHQLLETFGVLVKHYPFMNATFCSSGSQTTWIQLDVEFS